MKNKILFCAVVLSFCTYSMNMNAQLKVAANGNVGINSGTYTPLSNLTIGETSGLANTKLYIYGEGSGSTCAYGVYSSLKWGNMGEKCALYGYTIGAGGKVIGVKGKAGADGTVNVPICGIYGMAGGGSSGKNYGVFGRLDSGEQKGAGVYGTTNEGISTALADMYAGYFRGQTYVNGNLYYTNAYNTSDARLKRNITDIQSDAILKIRKLHPVQFQWQQVDEVSMEDTATVSTPHFSKDVDLDQRHYGLLAQDVQKLFPELVHEGGDGYLSVNYVELVPLLIEAVQELSAEVEVLKKQANK